jgi:hypothetical protein
MSATVNTMGKEQGWPSVQALGPTFVMHINEIVEDIAEVVTTEEEVPHEITTDPSQDIHTLPPLPWCITHDQEQVPLPDNQIEDEAIDIEMGTTKNGEHFDELPVLNEEMIYHYKQPEPAETGEGQPEPTQKYG